MECTKVQHKSEATKFLLHFLTYGGGYLHHLKLSFVKSSCLGRYPAYIFIEFVDCHSLLFIVSNCIKGLLQMLPC